MAKPQIEPRILKGFRDLLPNEAETRISLFELIRDVFKSACYLPIDTPALEYSEILLGKGSDETDKQLFRFKDQGDRDVALRFDLTVPLARFASQHRNELNFPFRRYHIAPVWRAEKPQKGRYREFYQCDFDIIGTKGVSSDIETLLLVSQIFEKIGLKYKIRLNHRVILNGIIEKFASGKNPTVVLRAIDKLEKLGEEIVKAELLKEAELNEEQAKNLLAFISGLKDQTDPLRAISLLEENLEKSSEITKTVSDLKLLFSVCNNQNNLLGSYAYDVSIARGLEYYTGVVFETQLLEFPTLGSVCSGGRYDNLASLFSNQALPGVGGSVGIDRLLVALMEKQVKTFNQNKKVLVTVFAGSLVENSFALANELRHENIVSEVYSDDAKIGNQLKYADKNNFDYALIVGPDEVATNKVQVKDLKNQTADNHILIDRAAVADYLKTLK